MRLLLKIQLIGIVIKGKQLGKSSPVDGALQLFFRAIVVVRPESLDKVLLGYPMIIITLQSLIYPTDDGQAKNAPRKHLLAAENACLRISTSKRSQ